MAKFDINSKYRMLSGYDIPVLGYGVYQTPPETTQEVVLHALKSGYRHVDSARMYRNEAPTAAAMSKSNILRSEVFFTTKIPPKSLGYDATKEAIAATFKATGIDYIDLYLIHAPFSDLKTRNETWLALVEAQQAGQIRSLGVSNYGVHHLEELSAYISELEAKNGKGKGGVISVGQYELHPWLARNDIVDWCQKHGVVLEAYSPVVQATRFEEKVLKKIAERSGKTPAQVLLRWSLQKGFVPLPKSVTPSRIEENANLYDFELTDAEMQSLETGEYSPVCWDPTKRTT